MDRMPLPSLRQPKAGCRLCRISSDTMAERHNRPRARCIEGGQSPAADIVDPTRVALDTPSTGLRSDPMVSVAGRCEWRPVQEDHHRRAREEAADRALEIRYVRRDHRRGGHESGIIAGSSSNPPGSDQSWWIQVDEPR